VQIAIVSFFNAGLLKVSDSGFFECRPGWVETRAVAWTFKTEISRFEHTAEVCAFKGLIAWNPSRSQPAAYG
jgi:hypothetical protein